MGNTKDFYKMFDKPIEVRRYPIKVPIPPEFLSALLADESEETTVPSSQSNSVFGTDTPSWMFDPTETPIDPNQYTTLPYSNMSPESYIDDKIDDNSRIVDSILISKMKIAIHDIEKAITVAQSGKGDYRSYIERAIAWLEDL